MSYSINSASTGISGSDFILTSGVITFAEGETEKTIDIQILNDSVAEADKTIIVELANLSAGSFETQQYVYTILDDEIPLVVIDSPANGVAFWH